MKSAGQWRFGRLYLVDYLFAAAATLAEAFTGLARYSALLNTAANEVRLSGVTVSYQIRSGDSDVDAVASQFALGVVLSLARHAAGREIRPQSMALASAAPPDYRELADRFGARQIEFGAECSTMTLAPADLSLPLPGSDARLATVLREHIAREIAAQAAASTWADVLRQFIAAHLADDGLSLPAAARRLALSPRSLQRRLQEEGATWRGIIDETRRDRAAVLLAGGLSRTAVAARLGFSDTRVLRGALRRWGLGAGG